MVRVGDKGGRLRVGELDGRVRGWEGEGGWVRDGRVRVGEGGMVRVGDKGGRLRVEVLGWESEDGRVRLGG